MYKVELLKVEDGRRFALLLKNGMPAYYPSLFITTQKRNSSFQTQRNIQNHLKLLYSWCELEGVNLDQRFKASEELTGLECLSLVDFCAWDSETIKRIRSGARMLKSAYTQVERSEATARVNHIVAYLKFLYRRLAGCGENDPQLLSMLKDLKAHKPNVKNYRKNRSFELTDEQEVVLKERIIPNHPDNPWSENRDVRLRNLIIVYLLLETGMRRAEATALRVNDFDFVDPAVSIYRRHDDPIDPRVDQPQAKTGERKIPISAELLEQIDNYIMNCRAKLPRTKKHPFLFVSHRRDKGTPISVQTINHLFVQLSSAFPEMGRLYPHKLRHHWNYTYSKQIDKKMKDCPDEDKKSFDENSRAYLMGWKPGGAMSQVYNRRYDEEEATEMLKKRDKKFQYSRKDDDA